MRGLGWFAAWPTGLALGVTTAVIASSDPAYAFAGSGAQIAVELVAGYALIASGLVLIRRRQSGTPGVPLVAGGCGWFLLEWNNPGVGAPLVFTIGLVFYASAPPLLAHALLAFPALRSGWRERAVMAIAYGGSVLALGLLPALVFDPGGQGCSQCPRNLLLVHGSPGPVPGAESRRGVRRARVDAAGAGALLGARMARSTRGAAPADRPGAGRRGARTWRLVAADFAASLRRGYLSNDPLDRCLWLGEAAALVCARAGSRVVLAARPPDPGGARAAGRRAGRALHRQAGLSGRSPAASATPVCGSPTRSRTAGTSTPTGGRSIRGRRRHRSLREGVEVAVLSHRPGLLDDPGLVEEVAATARLALDNERLHAELLAQLADLRASRARIVATGDDERRRLERDLHDGAQQRLVALALALRSLAPQLRTRIQPDRTLIARVEAGGRGAARCARGSCESSPPASSPPSSPTRASPPAVEALAEETPGQIRISEAPRAAIRSGDRDGRVPRHLRDGQASRHKPRSGSRPASPTGYSCWSSRARSRLPSCASSRTGSARSTAPSSSVTRRAATARIRAEIPCAS